MPPYLQWTRLHTLQVGVIWVALAVFLAIYVRAGFLHHSPEVTAFLQGQSELQLYILVHLAAGLALIGLCWWRRDHTAPDTPAFVGFVVLVLAEYAVLEVVLPNTGLRNIVFGFLVAPVAAYLWIWCVGLWRRPRAERRRGERVLSVFLAIMTFHIVVPEPFLPPFYRGIAGWTAFTPADPETPAIQIHVVQLIDCDGGMHIYSPPMVNSLSFFHRAMGRARTDDEKRQVLEFLYAEYERSYTLFAQGLGSHQWLLGAYAYPLHTVYKMNRFDHLPPDRVCAMAFTQVRTTLRSTEITLPEAEVLYSIDVRG